MFQERAGETVAAGVGVGLVICDGGASGALLEEPPCNEQVSGDLAFCPHLVRHIPQRNSHVSADYSGE
jgi:hypothetical protein